MNTEEQKIIDIRVKYEDAIYGITRFQEKIAELKSAQKQLDEQFKNGEITWNEHKLQTEAAASAITQYKENIRVLRKEIQNNLRTEQEQNGSLKQLRAQLSNANKAYDELSRAERNGAKGKEMVQHIKQITEELKTAEEETERYQRNVGNYYNSMFAALSDVKGLNILGIDGGAVDNAINQTVKLGQAAEGAGASFKALGSTLLALMGNPVFLAIAGIAGVGAAAKMWFDYNKGIAEASRLTTEFSGTTGEDMQAIRSELLSISSTLNVEFKDSLSAVDTLVAQFGISWADAIQVVKDGYAAGADLNNDMLSKMQQYAPIFKDMGLSAEEMTALLAQTRSGIFTDGGLDAITMAGKRLREMSTATKNSLESVGIDANKMMQQLSDGSINAFEAVQQVANRLNTVGVNSQEAGNIMKDVFGKQSVTAGSELLKSLADINISLEDTKKQTGEWGELQQELIDANAELNNVMAALFDATDNGFESWLDKGKLLTTEVLTGILKGIVDIYNYFADVYNESTIVRAGLSAIGVAFSGLGTTAKVVVDLIIDAFKGIGKNVKSLLQVFEGVLSLDMDKAKAGLSGLVTAWQETTQEIWNDAKQFGKDIGQAYVDGYNNVVGGAKLEHIKIPSTSGGETPSVKVGGSGNAKSGGNNGNNTGSVGSSSSKPSIDKAAAEAAKVAEKQLQSDILKIQMTYNEKMIQLKREYINGEITSEDEYNARVAELNKKRVTDMMSTYTNAGAIGEQKAQEMVDKLLDMEMKFNEQMKAQSEALIEQWKLEFEAQETQRSQALIDQGISEEVDNQAKLERYHTFLNEKAQLYADNAITTNAIMQEQAENENSIIEESYNKKKALIEKQKNDTMELANTLTDGMGSAFDEMFSDEEKNMKDFLKSMLITYLSFVEKKMSAQYVELLASSIIKGGFAGVASAAAKLALIKAAFAAAKSAIKGFSVGGYVSGAGTNTSDSIPARLSNGESVMTAKATSMFAPILSAFNQLGGGVPIVVNNAATDFGEEMLAAAIARGYMMCPPPVVSVEEVTNAQNRIKVIEKIGGV